MTDVVQSQEDPEALSFLKDGGAMGELIRSIDWSRTPLGPPRFWPQSLRTTLNLCLASNFPLCFAWGPQRVQIYNDGYWPLCAAKHPRSMGQDFKECWQSAWPVIGPGFERCVATGEPTFFTDTRMFLDRKGYLEETFFTFSFSPIRDEIGEVAGIFHPVTETTHLVLAKRRLGVLRDVASRTADAQTIDVALASVAQALASHPLEVPFVLLYRLEGVGDLARLAGVAGVNPGAETAPEQIPLDTGPLTGWPLAEVAGSNRLVEVGDLAERFDGFVCDPYPELLRTALASRITPGGSERPAAILIAGVSPRRALDESYREFFDMLAGAVTTAVTNGHARAEEKRRAESLAELDRAKTAFFANVSHEFRTPLTLILGPIADILADQVEPTTIRQRERLEIVQRNALRMHKLVNTLLDFSRIEAGRVQATYELTDLATFTAELVSNFRSACEQAGLELRVNCPPVQQPVYVDRDMWEKVVLNLVSNAFKYTLEGRIEVLLQQARGHVELVVRDTGTGIHADQIPRLFERFHRVEGAKGRTQEGSGIGLALVRELVHLLGGEVRAESVVGQGSVFTVSVPLGKEHLPPDRIRASVQLSSAALGATPYVEEALRWIPARNDQGPPTKAPLTAVEKDPQVDHLGRGLPIPDSRPRILLADDNADMRDYVRRLLAERFEVVAVANGLAALAAARERPPELVVSDVMMPGLDGFGLLRELRADPRTVEVPIVLLSARAGEEARREGMEAGADDYLIKPFSAHDLMTRIGALLELARVRRAAADVVLGESEERFRLLVDGVQEYAIFMLDPTGRVATWNTGAQRIKGYRAGEIIGRHFSCFYSEEDIASGKPEWELGKALSEGRCEDEGWRIRNDGTRFWARVVITALYDKSGRSRGFAKVTRDITERARAETMLRESEAKFRSYIENAPVAVLVADGEGRFVECNPAAVALLGYDAATLVGMPIPALHPEEDRADVLRTLDTLTREGSVEGEFRLRRRDGGLIWVTLRAVLLPDGHSLGYCQDITQRKLAEAALRTERDWLANIVSTVPVVICSFRQRTDGTVCMPFASPAIEQIYGHRPEVLMEDASPIFARMHPADVGRVHVAIEESARTMTPWRCEFRVLNPTRGDIWVEGHSIPIPEPNGDILWQGYIADITQRKRADEALRERERLLGIVTGSARVGLVVVGKGYRYLFANEAYAEILGLETHEIVGRRVPDVLVAAWPQIQPRLDRALAGERVAYELSLPPLAGASARSYTVVYEPRSGDDDAQTVVVVVDITERKRAEEALRESEHRLRLFVEHAPAALAMFDDQMRYLVVSRRWLADYSLPAGDITGEFHYALFPEVPENWKIIHRRGLAGEIVQADEDRFVRADGSEQWLRWEVRPWHRAEGTIGGIVIFSEDITARKRAEAALHQVNADLERGMQQLAEANQELKARTQENEAFVYSVSHDLRSPLVNLQGFSKELDRSALELRALLTERAVLPSVRDRGIGILDGPVAKSLRFIQTAVTRLSSIIDALLRLSRAGRVTYQRQRVDVESVVARVVEALQITTQERGAMIQIHPLLPALGDPAALEQVFANLIGNALNYLDRKKPGRIEVGILPPGGENTVPGLRTYYVRDNGLGIPEASGAKVFQPFQRLHPQAATGEGMGLAIVQRVVERHGGRIWFKSVPGQGTVFFVTLPAWQQGESPGALPDAPDPRSPPP